MSETAEKAKSLFDGHRDYHDDARRTLPVLVRQAGASEPIEYGVLAAEVGVNGARNMRYPLGCIGQTLVELGRRWGEQIPAIQTLVVNKQDGLPGVGVAHFTPNPKLFARATKSEKRIIVRQILQEVFAYPSWNRVLAELKLEPLSPAALPDPGKVSRRGKGEGAEHLVLKRFVAAHPHVVGAAGMVPEIEASLQSADVIDVLFRGRRRMIAAEVKGVKSDTRDVLRGLFQCMKYQALLEAEAKVGGRRVDIEAVLALGGPLPPEARTVANTLGLRVVDKLSGP